MLTFVTRISNHLLFLPLTHDLHIIFSDLLLLRVTSTAVCTWNLSRSFKTDENSVCRQKYVTSSLSLTMDSVVSYRPARGNPHRGNNTLHSSTPTDRGWNRVRIFAHISWWFFMEFQQKETESPLNTIIFLHDAWSRR